MKLPKLTLRDLFWLILAAAVSWGWGVSHYRAAQQVAKQSTPYTKYLPWVSRPHQPSEETQRRAAALARLRQLSDAELSEHFAKIRSPSWRSEFYSDYQPCLTELIRRGLASDIQQACDRLADAEPDLGDYPDDLQLLTALRRAQRRPDPVKIHVDLPQRDREGRMISFPQVTATFENVDVEKLPMHYTEGGDYRSGRAERWRVHLTNERGERVADCNFLYGGMGGGLVTFRRLDFGEKGQRNHSLDARSYAQPPPPGKYRLQLIHSEQGIADEPNLDGLIVLQSDPIDVIVTAPNDSASISVTPLLLVLSLTGAIVAGMAIHQLWRKSRGGKATAPYYFNSRDLLCLALVASLAVLWHCDNRFLAHKLRSTQLDQEASWSWHLAD